MVFLSTFGSIFVFKQLLSVWAVGKTTELGFVFSVVGPCGFSELAGLVCRDRWSSKHAHPVISLVCSTSPFLSAVHLLYSLSQLFQVLVLLFLLISKFLED